MSLKGILSINMKAIIEVENITSKITTPLPQDVQFLLRDNLSYVVSGAMFSEYAKQGMWDGCKHLYSMKTQSFPTGLLRRVLTTLNDCSYKYEIIDKRVKPELGKEIKLKNIKLRDYQEESVDILFNKTRGLLHSSTASGKSIILSSLLGKLNIKSLIIVPTTSLLHQTASVIQKVLGVKVGKIGDSIKDIKKITVATFQSLVDSDDTKKRKLDSETGRWKTVGAKKMEVRKDLKDYFNGVECLITDECFPGLTPVNTEYGYMDIAEIVDNELPIKVWSFNVEKQLFELKPVVRYFKKQHEDMTIVVHFDDGTRVESTPNHEYYVLDNGKVVKKSAETINEGDKVITMSTSVDHKSSNTNYILSTVESSDVFLLGPRYVYNIEVEGNHNYLVGNNKLVSNCHHIISQSIQKVYEACPNAYYRYGLSATPFSDRDEDVLIEAATGRVLKELSASYLISKGWLSKPTIHLVPYKQQRGGNSTTYAGLYKEKITENEERNKLLTKIISMRADMGDSVLVSVRYLEHGKTLYNMLVDKYGDDVVFVNSSVSTNRLNEVLKDLSKKKLKICISTSILQEGVDVPSLNTLVMAGSPKSKIATMQLVGRVLRKTDDKSTVDVYDIQDYNTKYFSSSAKERFNIYSSEPEFILKEDNMFGEENNGKN